MNDANVTSRRELLLLLSASVPTHQCNTCSSLLYCHLLQVKNCSSSLPCAVEMLRLNPPFLPHLAEPLSFVPQQPSCMFFPTRVASAINVADLLPLKSKVSMAGVAAPYFVVWVSWSSIFRFTRTSLPCRFLSLATFACK